MTDESAVYAENMAQMMAAVYRLSQLLSIPIEDATTVFVKLIGALGKVEKDKRSIS